MSKRMNRFHMERLETRQMMARNTGTELDDPGLAEPNDPVAQDPSLGEPPAEVSRTRPSARGDFQIPESLDPPPQGGEVGDVTAQIIDGSLYLSESAGFEGSENGIKVTQLSNGMIRIEGISAAGGPASLINGAAFQDFVVTGNLSIDFGGGKDRVEFGADGPAILQNLLIDVGATSAAGDSDNDIVIITNVEAQGSVTIRTGAGADRVSFLGSTHVMGGVDICTYSSAGEADRDVVTFRDRHIIYQGLSVDLGGGDDTFAANNLLLPEQVDTYLSVFAALVVNAGAGDDTILMTQVTAGAAGPVDSIDSLQLFTGAGGDTIKIDNCDFNNAMIKTWDSLGEIDRETMEVQRTRFATVTVDMGGGGDDFFVTDPEDMAVNRGIYADILHVATGAGVDKVHIEGSTIGPLNASTGLLLIQTGAGADEVTVDFRNVQLPDGNWLDPVLRGNLGIQTYDDPSEADVDHVSIPSAQIEGFATIDLGAGDDVFSMLGGNYGSVFIEAGDGADDGEFHGFIDGYMDNQCRIHMGRGTDALTLGHVRAADILSLSGGEDGDSLWYTEELYFIDQLFENGWEYINGFPMWQQEIAPGPGDGGVIGAP